MITETTVYVHEHTREKIKKIMASTGKTKQAIVVWALSKMSEDTDSHTITWSRVKYQPRNRNTKWTQIHIYLSPAEYELFIDLRKIYKSSVSRMVAIAIEKYLKEMIPKEGILSTNYSKKNYAMSRIILNGITTWIFYWGIPQKILPSSC
jgi:hypothetical protein